MNRWTKLWIAAPALGMLALGGLPARAEDTGAVKKDDEHAAKIHERMKARSAKTRADKKRSLKERAKTTADQGADAMRVGGAKTAKTWHKGTHAARKGTHRAAKKVEKATD